MFPLDEILSDLVLFEKVQQLLFVFSVPFQAGALSQLMFQFGRGLILPNLFPGLFAAFETDGISERSTYFILFFGARNENNVGIAVYFNLLKKI